MIYPVDSVIHPSSKPGQMFSVHTTPEEFENAKITAFIFDLCLRKTLIGKSHYYRDYIVFEKLRFLGPRESEKQVFSNYSGLRSVFVIVDEDKIRVNYHA